MCQMVPRHYLSFDSSEATPVGRVCLTIPSDICLTKLRLYCILRMSLFISCSIGGIFRGSLTKFQLVIRYARGNQTFFRKVYLQIYLGRSCLLYDNPFGTSVGLMFGFIALLYFMLLDHSYSFIANQTQTLPYLSLVLPFLVTASKSLARLLLKRNSTIQSSASSMCGPYAITCLGFAN